MNDTQSNDEMIERLKETADALLNGRGEDELRRELLESGMSADDTDQYLDIAVQYNDLAYRRTGFKFFVLGLGFLVVGIALMLSSMWLFPLAVWTHYVLLGCIAASGVNLLLGFWRTVMHNDPRAKEAADRMHQREQALEASPASGSDLPRDDE
ncbi:MAG: hypothetical protein K8R90_03180 [Candidatus Cloacimonetes bacterium]|nr:hypothetical protein [Candidatus Cloacimonadota bacterium]